MTVHRCPYCGQEHTSSWHLAYHTNRFHEVPRGWKSLSSGRWIYPRGYWKYVGLRTYWRHLMALMDPTWTTGKRFKRS